MELWAGPGLVYNGLSSLQIFGANGPGGLSVLDNGPGPV